MRRKSVVKNRHALKAGYTRFSAATHQLTAVYMRSGSRGRSQRGRGDESSHPDRISFPSACLLDPIWAPKTRSRWHVEQPMHYLSDPDGPRAPDRCAAAPTRLLSWGHGSDRIISASLCTSRTGADCPARPRRFCATRSVHAREATLRRHPGSPWRFGRHKQVPLNP